MFESDPYYLEARMADIRRDVMAAKLAGVIGEILDERPQRPARATESLHARFMAYRSQV